MSDLDASIGEVTESSSAGVAVQISDYSVFEKHKAQLSVGQYLLLAAGNTEYVLATITAVRAIPVEGAEKARFKLETQPVGTWRPGSDFERGTQNLPVPTEPAHIAPPEVLKEIFATGGAASFSFGSLAIDDAVPLEMDGDRFFSKHIAIVGSTGSGKSCAVASILQRVVGFSEAKNLYKGAQRNSHIVIFDIHSEYAEAFKLHKDEDFTLNLLDVDNLVLPYWLMNAEELEEIFIESNEMNSHNQISQFRHAVVCNKRKHNPGISDLSFDTPVFFSIDEVCLYLENMNAEVVGKLPGEGKPKLEDGTLVEDRDGYFLERKAFWTASQSKETKASNGPFHGEFDRLILRLRTRLADPRLSFLFYPKKDDGAELRTGDFADVVRQFIGYHLKTANISVVDVSGIPFEVLSLVVSLISRMIFDFGFHYSKIRHSGGNVSDVPIMVVCEEAHNYVPRSGGAQYNASRKSIERIAKEGRKYGVTLMVVSQRPSEVSETIFSQCSNYIALRLTNIGDQGYIKSLLPDMSAAIGDLLPNLAQGEFIAVGDAMLMPSVGRFKLPQPEPQSQSVKYLEEWNSEWRTIDFDEVIARWKSRRSGSAGSS